MSTVYRHMAESYGSHLPVLTALLPYWRNKRVIEFGCGDYSTPFLNKHAYKVLSIEQCSPDYANGQRSMGYEVEYRPYHTEKQATPEECSTDWAMIFVDGAPSARRACVEWAFDHAPLVVAHDSEDPYYGYDLINTPAGWVCFDTLGGTKQRPSTRVWMRVTKEGKYEA